VKIQLFKNDKGIIFGSDPKRISCDIGGVLRIGSTKIEVKAATENIFPLLFNGSTGKYKATFTSEIGTVYELAEVTVKGGRVLPPSQTAIEFMELRCRMEYLEAKCLELSDEIVRLNGIFDTNSLNFIIKGEEEK
jgi:hypothetical protein